jgi:hypothetical protein
MFRKFFWILFLVVALPLALGCERLGIGQKSPEEQLKQAATELARKNYGQTIELTVKVIGETPHNAEAHYLRAQAESMSGGLQNALNELEASLNDGLKNVEDILKNPHLAPVRDTSEFRALMIRRGLAPEATADAATGQVQAGDVSIKTEGGQQVIRAGNIVLKVPVDK